jgi:hypothetical protein
MSVSAGWNETLALAKVLPTSQRKASEYRGGSMRKKKFREGELVDILQYHKNRNLTSPDDS